MVPLLGDNLPPKLSSVDHGLELFGASALYDYVDIVHIGPVDQNATVEVDRFAGHGDLNQAAFHYDLHSPVGGVVELRKAKK